MRLIQFIDDDGLPCAGRVNDAGQQVNRLGEYRSSFALAQAALKNAVSLTGALPAHLDEIDVPVMGAPLINPLALAHRSLACGAVREL